MRLYFKLVADRKMGETFYSVLGVDPDADRETIRRAYRDLVKETHPDVSDDPDAGEQFKRLTTARDVLVDDRNRRRYDRLGHDAYVRQHVKHSAWTADGSVDAGTTTDSTDQRTASKHPNATRQGPTDGGNETRSTARGGGARSRTDGGYGSADWQTASEAYRRTPVDVDTGESSLFGRAVAAGRELGSWLFVYLVVLVSAAATGWFFYATSRYAEVSVPLLLGGVVIVLSFVSLSIVHMLQKLA